MERVESELTRNENEPIGTYEDDKDFSKDVMSKEALPEGIQQVKDHLDINFLKYGENFKSREACDDFFMLPITHEQKMMVLNRALELEEKKKSK